MGRVKSISQPQINASLLTNAGITSKQQLVQVEILEGPLKGQIFGITNEITDNPSFNVNAIPGKEVVLSVVQSDKSPAELNIADYHRAPALFALAGVFLAAYLIFGGKNGLKSLAGLLTAIALIGLVLLPLSLQGFNPLISSTLICVAAALVTVLCVGGFSKKSAAAILGTAGGVIIAGIASQAIIDSAPLTGLSSEEAQILRGSVLSQPPEFFAGLLAASMLIGALGVIMDVAISIASAVFEIKEANPELDSKELYRRGMNVGRDIMGSMTTTLVLAYAGSALPLLLLMAHMPSIKLLNLDLVATEIASALTGSLGLVCTIPLTALAAARLMRSEN
ncbi:MAG: YibE/F family protein [Candidatus Obscuribacterales bacterium]|nr:YibE/F family protein [Candidatus Obscuribacterales bacterium]